MDTMSILNQELTEFLQQGQDTGKRDKSASRIQLTLNGLTRMLGLKGTVHRFGSFSNGFKTGTSDLDVVLVGEDSESAVSILQKFAENIPTLDLSFVNVTKIFQASVPLLKLTDRDSEMEVDFCVNNQLGVRNSLLLNTYCKYDIRVLHLGRLVKEWAKKHELVGTADGYLNSYAYMLLVVFFLQSVQPAVVPNLQMLATESFRVADRKWGGEDYWETKFQIEVDNLPKSQNHMSIGELLINFFQFYTRDFNWRQHAVCMRKFEPGKPVDKSSLLLSTIEEQWYVEDPFDLKHNLAGKCTRAGKKRIMDEMKNALQTIQQTGRFSKCLPEVSGNEFYMKCRVSQNVQPPDLLEAFEEFDLVKLHFPKPDSSMRMAQAFLQFGSAAARRRAHTKNESYICDCQLQLHYSSQHSLAEAITQCQFSTYEMASYKMQRQVLKARMQGGQDMHFDAMKQEMQPEVAPLQFQQAMNFQQLKAVKDTRMKRMDLRPSEVNMNVQMHQFPPAMMMQQWGHQANMLFSHQPHQPPYPVPRNSPQVPPTPPQPVRKAEKEEAAKEKDRKKVVNATLARAAPKAEAKTSNNKQIPGDKVHAGEGWLQVTLTNNLPEFPPELVGKLLQLVDRYPAKNKPIERKPEPSDEISLLAKITYEPPSESEPFHLSPDLYLQLEKAKQHIDKVTATVP